MNTPRFLRSVLVRGLLAAALSTTSAFATSKEELAALRAKAENGNGMAQYNLGLLYATQGDPLADPIEAYVWFNLAADNGATGRALVLLSSQMNTEQVAEAKQRLATRREELDSKRKRGATAAVSPVSPAAPAATPNASDTSSPIVAAPTLPDPPISAAPLSERDYAALQNELKKMSGELSGVWKENEQLKATIARGGSTSAATEQLQRERDQLRTTLAATNDELAKLRAQTANFEGERNALQQKITAAGQAQKDSLGAELAATTTKLHTVEGLLAQAGAASGELANAKQQLASLGEQVQKLTAENQRLANLSAQAAPAAEAKAAAEKELAALRTELSSTQAQLNAVKAASSTNSATQKQLEESQVKLESSLRSFELQQKELDRVQKALANIDGEREGLAKQVADLKSAASKPDTAGAQRIAQLTADLEAARSAGAKVNPLQKQLADSQAKLKSTEDELARVRHDKDEISQQLAAAKAAPVAAPGEITRLNSELTDVRGRLGAAEHALARSKEEHDRAAQEASSSAQQKVTQLTSELQQLREKSAASAHGLVAANQERDSLRQQLASAAASSAAATEVTALQARLKASEQALAAANSERSALAERLSAAESKASAAAAVSTPALPAPGEDPAELHKELTETQGKLNAALRTYQLQQDEVDRLQKALANIDAERAQLADRVHSADTQASQAQAQVAANQDAASQLAAVREQFRQAQNQIASLAGENSQLKNRLALAAPSPTPIPVAGVSTPSRPAVVPALAAVPASRPASAPAAPTRPTPPPAPRTHTVADGDTLTKIARRYYGSSDRWPQILEANRNVIKDVNNLTLGTTLRIP